MEDILMNQRAFLLIAGVVFGLIALGHLLRVVFGVSFVVQNIAVPMWASVVAVVIMAYLAYEGFHFARKIPPKP
jgi:threonine/homoserine/homoserine lactone efflux protein